MSGPDQVAVITDIHANPPALQAALARVDELGIERVDCGGDLVGYGPHPNEVCALIQERDIPTIYGNYDDAFARDLEDCGCAYRDAHDRKLGELSVAWTLEHTDQRAKDFMRRRSTPTSSWPPLRRSLANPSASELLGSKPLGRRELAVSPSTVSGSSNADNRAAASVCGT